MVGHVRTSVCPSTMKPHLGSRLNRGCYETLPSLRDSDQIFHLPSTPPSAPCWAKLSRAYGTRISLSFFHRGEGELSFVTASNNAACALPHLTCTLTADPSSSDDSTSRQLES